MSPSRSQPRLAAGRARALGQPTRGTTNPNRLRRMDNWIASTLGSLLRTTSAPTVVDLGYGHSAVTAVELLDRLRRVNPSVQVLGIEIDVDRVVSAKPSERPGLTFAQGGFELGGRRALVIRAANVLRQYPESAVAQSWRTMCAALEPGGYVVEGTCDEIGRRGSWVLLDASGPLSLTLSCKVDDIRRPSDIAPRLVKSLISHNVSGENIGGFLADLDLAWDTHAGLATFGARQRWMASCATVAQSWPVRSSGGRHRFGEITVA